MPPGSGRLVVNRPDAVRDDGSHPVNCETKTPARVPLCSLASCKASGGNPAARKLNSMTARPAGSKAGCP
jgi:hypothetical protein